MVSLMDCPDGLVLGEGIMISDGIVLGDGFLGTVMASEEMGLSSGTDHLLRLPLLAANRALAESCWEMGWSGDGSVLGMGSCRILRPLQRWSECGERSSWRQCRGMMLHAYGDETSPCRTTVCILRDGRQLAGSLALYPPPGALPETKTYHAQPARTTRHEFRAAERNSASFIN